MIFIRCYYQVLFGCSLTKMWAWDVFEGQLNIKIWVANNYFNKIKHESLRDKFHSVIQRRMLKAPPVNPRVYIYR